jgi:hypothetical protein
LLIGDNRLEPFTVNVTLTEVALELGVMTTEELVELVGVALVIAQEYVGDVMPEITADNVAVDGVNAPPELTTKPVNPDMSTSGESCPAAPGSANTY